MTLVNTLAECGKGTTKDANPMKKETRSVSEANLVQASSSLTLRVEDTTGTTAAIEVQVDHVVSSEFIGHRDHRGHGEDGRCIHTIAIPEKAIEVGRLSGFDGKHSPRPNPVLLSVNSVPSVAKKQDYPPDSQ
jgi:hypothetical protein